MRYKQGQKEQTHKRIIDAASRCFRKSGFSGVGVDGLAKEASVTSGAFYGHFDSKLAAFSAAISSGLEELRIAITHLQEEHGNKWWTTFASFYMGQKRTCDLSESCALQSLTPEVGRADQAIRTLYEAELLKIVQSASKDTATQEPDQAMINKTWASLAMLVGGVSLARAVSDERLSDEIATAIENAVISIHKAE